MALRRNLSRLRIRWGSCCQRENRRPVENDCVVFDCEWQVGKQGAWLTIASLLFVVSFCQIDGKQKGTMKNIKFVVKVNRGAHAPQYVQRVDRLPIQTTTDRKLALVMGRFTAEDAVKSMQTSHCNPELVSVRVSA